MKKSSVLISLLLSACLSSNAAVAQRDWVKIQQSDGTYLWVQGHGDELLHWYSTKDGVLLYQQGTDFYIAKTEAYGAITSTGQLAHEADGRSAKEMMLVASQDKDLFFNATASNIARAKSVMEEILEGNTPAFFPHKGAPKVLVILADYADEKFIYDDTATKHIFDQYFNADGRPSSSYDTKTHKTYCLNSNFGSVKKYFKDMSFGAFAPNFDVYGPVHLPQNMHYYGNSGNNRMDRFIPDVCKAAKEQLSVDFSRYDSNKDGEVDLLCVIFAGYSGSITGNSTDCLWPKSGTHLCGPYDGVKIRRYCISNELGGNPKKVTQYGGAYLFNGIGLFCHEFSHTMGLPDFYSTSSYAQCDNQGMEDWSVMDGGEYIPNGFGYYPTAYTAWEREALGWMDIETLTDKGTYKINSLTQGQDDASAEYKIGHAYRIYNDQDNTKNEYYILENIQPENWNKNLGMIDRRPHGMMITHVNFSSSRFTSGLSNTVNTEKGKPRMTILPADGTLPSSYTTSDFRKNMNSQLYPGKCNVTTFDYQLPARTLTTIEGRDTTVTAYPNPIVYVGSDATMAYQKSLYNIREENGTVYFDFKEPTPTAIRPIDIIEQKENNDIRIFSLDGRYLGTDLNALPKGIYLRAGRKIMKK